jgi:hypothetical protein
MSYEGDSQVFDIPTNLSNIVAPPTSYDKSILSRDEIRFNAQAIAYNNTARDITIRLNSAGYLDTATSYLFVDLKVDYSNCQILEEGLFNLIGQATLSVAGKIVERIEDVSELLPLLKHSCTQEWLQTEGKLGGQYRYCKSAGYQTAIQNTDAVDDKNDSINITVMPGGPTSADGTVSEVKMPIAGVETEGSVVIGRNSNNPCYTGSTVRHNSMNTCGKGPGNHTFWKNLPEGTNNADDQARTLCIPLSLVFGLFRQHNTYLPVRNMPLEIKLTLKQYAEAFIHVPPCVSDVLQQRALPITADVAAGDTVLPATGTTIAPIITNLTDNNFAGYSLTNVHILTDILTPAPALVSKIDSMAAGNTGISMIIDTYNVNKQPVQYAENINLVSTRSYSHLKDVYTTFKPAEIETNLFLQKTDRYYGSLVESVSTQIGSKVMPSTNPADSINELFINLRKCLGIQNNIGNSRGVVSLDSYQGKPDAPMANTLKLGMSHGFIPDMFLARATTGANLTKKLLNAHALPAQCHSNFVIGTNTQRVLASSSLSGLNSIGTSYTCTTKVKLKRFNNNADGSANNASLDNCFGNLDLIACQIMHSDVLISVSNGLVNVLE